MELERLTTLQIKQATLLSQRERTQHLHGALTPTEEDLKLPDGYNERIANLHPRGADKLRIDSNSPTFMEDFRRIGRLQKAIPERILPAFDKRIAQVEESIKQLRIEEAQKQRESELRDIDTREQAALQDVAGLGEAAINMVKAVFNRERAELGTKDEGTKEIVKPTNEPQPNRDSKPEKGLDHRERRQSSVVILPDGQEVIVAGSQLQRIATQFLDAHKKQSLVDGFSGSQEIYGSPTKNNRKKYRAMINHLKDKIIPAGWTIRQLLAEEELNTDKLPALYTLEKLVSKPEEAEKNIALTYFIHTRIGSLNDYKPRLESGGYHNQLPFTDAEISKMKQLLAVLPKLPALDAQTTAVLEAVITNTNEKGLAQKIYKEALENGEMTLVEAMVQIPDAISALNEQLDPAGIKIDYSSNIVRMVFLTDTVAK